jgi:hypothetical protein
VTDRSIRVKGIAVLDAKAASADSLVNLDSCETLFSLCFWDTEGKQAFVASTCFEEATERNINDVKLRLVPIRAPELTRSFIVRDAETFCLVQAKDTLFLVGGGKLHGVDTNNGTVEHHAASTRATASLGSSPMVTSAGKSDRCAIANHGVGALTESLKSKAILRT